MEFFINRQLGEAQGTNFDEEAFRKAIQDFTWSLRMHMNLDDIIIRNNDNRITIY
jgi:hypothetical protein